ncbi:uncharacterized protein LOC110037418 [Phalaenopsis equestris]|uniref:uncharacterized protein LOC110037418 n=1 Tax=Phalaenopsis equestris TaxID=78828 RepID=UPI0009E2C960|nr:uncharacterized protein LOC110037418 [Phalaenopsis equestris]
MDIPATSLNRRIHLNAGLQKLAESFLDSAPMASRVGEEVPAKRNWFVLSRSRFRRLLHSCEEIMDAKVVWKSREDNKQLSPVSVFEFHSAEFLSPHNHSTEEENRSTSTMNSDMSEEAHYFTCFSNLNQTENGARKDKQPLLKCRKELKERIFASHYGLSQSKSEKSREMQIFSVEKHRKEVARIAKLIDMDLSGTRREWSHFKDEAKKTGLEIERLIFEEIREETVVEMFGSHFYTR